MDEQHQQPGCAPFTPAIVEDSRFTQLPAELRSMIYEFLLPNRKKTLRIPVGDGRIPAWLVRKEETRVEFALLHTNRLIRFEVTGLLLERKSGAQLRSPISERQHQVTKYPASGRHALGLGPHVHTSIASCCQH